MSEFLFLEIADRDLNSLFGRMREILGDERQTKPMHLTVRGPYAHGVPSVAVERAEKIMSHDVLRIKDVDKFSNPTEEVVFLRVNSPNLRRIWWKPDFPIKKYGFNPHISLYRGQDQELARALLKFLQHENLDLKCAEFKFVTHVQKQMFLFKPRVPTTLVDTGRVRPNLLDRLQLVVNRYHRRVGDQPTGAWEADLK